MMSFTDQAKAADPLRPGLRTQGKLIFWSFEVMISRDSMRLHAETGLLGVKFLIVVFVAFIYTKYCIFAEKRHSGRLLQKRPWNSASKWSSFGAGWTQSSPIQTSGANSASWKGMFIYSFDFNIIVNSIASFTCNTCNTFCNTSMWWFTYSEHDCYWLES